MDNKDYYRRLGIGQDADASVIKKAFRTKAMQYHPDRNRGDKTAEQKFKDINEAYEVLKDDSKKAAYDRYGTTNFQNAGAPHGGSGGFEDLSDVFGDIFGDFMGEGRRTRQSQEGHNLRGSDLKYGMSITLENAYLGLKKKIRLSTLSACTGCNSRGSRSGTGNQKCRSCNGIGKQRVQQGFFMIEKTCSNCLGMGATINDPCNKCSGQGRMKKEREILINIPAGIDTGSRLRLSGEGEAGVRGAQAGDLYIDIDVKEHDFYQRDRNDLHCEVPMKMVTAILGGEVKIPTLDGKVAKISIPPETQPGSKLRLRGKGMSAARSTRHGDLYVHVNVELPKKISTRQKELLQEFDGLNNSGSNPQTDSFFARVKNFVADIRK
jgi:molecular chaperone DnaJ